MSKPKPSTPLDRKARAPGALLGVLLAILLGIAAIGIALRFGDAWPTLGIGLMLCALVLIVYVLYRAAGPAPHDSPHELLPDAASEAEHQAALDRLAALPHFHQLSDGTLFDYLVGTKVEPCDCGRYSAFHLLVSYGNERGLALVTRGALAQYVAVQEAVAARITRQTEGC